MGESSKARDADSVSVSRKKNICPRRSSGGEPASIFLDETGWGKSESVRKIQHRNQFTRNAEERSSFSTYQTISKSEFQKRRASFEKRQFDFHEEKSSLKDNAKIVGCESRRKLFQSWKSLDGKVGRLKPSDYCKTRSLEDLVYPDDCVSSDVYQRQEKNMTDKLKEIHGLVEDMQKMSERLKVERFLEEEKGCWNAGGEICNEEDRYGIDSFWSKQSTKSKTPPTRTVVQRASGDWGKRVYTITHLPGFRMTSKSTHEEILVPGQKGGNQIIRYESSCTLTPMMIPTQFTSTIIVRIGSTRKRFVEEVQFQNRLVPSRYSEGLETSSPSPPQKMFRSSLHIDCNPIRETIIKLRQPFIYHDLILPLDKRMPVFI